MYVRWPSLPVRQTPQSPCPEIVVASPEPPSGPAAISSNERSALGNETLVSAEPLGGPRRAPARRADAHPLDDEPGRSHAADSRRLAAIVTLTVTIGRFA